MRHYLEAVTLWRIDNIGMIYLHSTQRFNYTAKVGKNAHNTKQFGNYFVSLQQKAENE
jgi:hypothetical protein